MNEATAMGVRTIGVRTIKQVFRSDWSPEMALNLSCFPELVQVPIAESNRPPSKGSGGRLGACLCVSGRVGEPSNRQGTALFNQGIDSLNHRVAGKAESRIGLESARGWRE